MISFQEVTDIKPLAELADEIWHEYWPAKISAEQTDYMVNKFQSETAIKSQIENENYVYFFIITEDKIAGYMGLSKEQDYLFLSKIYIKKDFRGQGIGGKAFGFIKEFAQNLRYEKIILTVNKYNYDTISAYKKWGFETVDSVVTDIGNGFVMDDYIMEYRI